MGIVVEEVFLVGGIFGFIFCMREEFRWEFWWVEIRMILCIMVGFIWWEKFFLYF